MKVFTEADTQSRTFQSGSQGDERLVIDLEQALGVAAEALALDGSR